MESIRQQLTPAHKLEYDLDDELPNEFTQNNEIIYGSFRHLFPLGDLSNLIGKGSVPEAVTKRLMTFLDPRFARDAGFRTLSFHS